MPNVGDLVLIDGEQWKLGESWGNENHEGARLSDGFHAMIGFSRGVPFVHQNLWEIRRVKARKMYPDFCPTCDGVGHSIANDDPRLVWVCKECRGKNKCPWCGSEIRREEFTQCENCGYEVKMHW